MAVARPSMKSYLSAPFQRRHWRAALNIPRVVSRPADFAWRYVLERGSYPSEITVRTPLGPLALTVYSPHDVSTINEIFCRLDYDAGAGIRSVVDMGANIGISAAYFLTRNADVRVWAYEAAPANVPRLRAQLERFGDRVHIEEVAVSTEDGEIEFGVEPSGRYGSVWIVDGQQTIRVRARSVNSILEEVLAEVGELDLLKLDIEGYEPQVMGAIRRDLARRIRAVVLEFAGPIQSHREVFEITSDGATNWLRRREPTNAVEPRHEP